MTSENRNLTPALPEATTQAADNALLSLGDIATRHLIARTSETDIIVRSIEHITHVAENTVEMRTLIDTVKHPYERLFLGHAEQQPKRGRKEYFEALDSRMRSGRWSFIEPTEGGNLTSNVVYGFARDKEDVRVRYAKVEISSLHDATAKMSISFNNNSITRLNLGWTEYGRSKTQPNALLKNLSGTELGEFIDKTVGPYSLHEGRGAQNITFVLGQHPFISASRDSYYYPKDEGKEGEWHMHSDSDFQYNPEKHLFIRQHGLKEINDSDNLTALTVEEAAIVVHQLLKLVPAISI